MTGTCWCGCGERTPIATKTSARDGWIKGEPIRYIHGHNGRLPRTSRRAFVAPTTGHPLGDALLPAALQLVDAVHTESRTDALDAIAAAHQAANQDPYWVFAFVCTLAALVPEDARLSELLAWSTPTAPRPRAAHPIHEEPAA